MNCFNKIKITSFILLTSVLSTGLFGCTSNSIFANKMYELVMNENGQFYLQNDKESIPIDLKKLTKESNLTPVIIGDTWYVNGCNTNLSSKYHLETKLHIGFDGYIWNKNIRTSYQCESMDTTIIDNTFPILGSMSLYYKSSSLNLDNMSIALMNGYDKYTKTTNYSSQHIESIDFNITSPGSLSIGTCKIRNAINATTDADKFYFDSKATYHVEKGINCFDVNIDILEDETLAIQGDCGLMMYDSIPSVSMEGCFLLYDTFCHDDIISKNKKINKRIVTKVTASSNTSMINHDRLAIKEIVENNFKGKTFSILGDSLSAYAGVSNNESVNIHLKGNYSTYNGEFADHLLEKDMWYYQLAEDFDMKLLVNNSSSGSTVMKKNYDDERVGYQRSTYLSYDNGDLKDNAPDYIFVYLGGNDCLLESEGIHDVIYKEPSSELLEALRDGNDYHEPELYDFTSAYMLMIEKMINTYPTSRIYIIGSYEIELSAIKSYWDALNALNDNLSKIAKYFNLDYLCLRNNTCLNIAKVGDYLADNAHPNKKGFNHFTDQIEIEIINSLKQQNRI